MPDDPKPSMISPPPLLLGEPFRRYSRVPEIISLPSFLVCPYNRSNTRCSHTRRISLTPPECMSRVSRKNANQCHTSMSFPSWQRTLLVPLVISFVYWAIRFERITATLINPPQRTGDLTVATSLPSHSPYPPPPPPLISLPSLKTLPSKADDNDAKSPHFSLPYDLFLHEIQPRMRAGDVDTLLSHQRPWLTSALLSPFASSSSSHNHRLLGYYDRYPDLPIHSIFTCIHTRHLRCIRFLLKHYASLLTTHARRVIALRCVQAQLDTLIPALTHDLQHGRDAFDISFPGSHQRVDSVDSEDDYSESHQLQTHSFLSTFMILNAILHGWKSMSMLEIRVQLMRVLDYDILPNVLSSLGQQDVTLGHVLLELGAGYSIQARTAAFIPCVPFNTANSYIPFLDALLRLGVDETIAFGYESISLALSLDHSKTGLLLHYLLTARPASTYMPLLRAACGRGHAGLVQHLFIKHPSARNDLRNVCLATLQARPSHSKAKPNPVLAILQIL